MTFSLASLNFGFQLLSFLSCNFKITPVDCGNNGTQTTIDLDYTSLINKYSVGAHVITGTEGNDRITGTILDDLIKGNGGNDNIGGHKGNDILLGGEGNDYLHGDLGVWSMMFGAAGNDTLYGGGSNDLIVGGSGDDLIDGGGAGSDVLTGGSGADKFTIRGTTGDMEDAFTITQRFGCKSITLDVQQKTIVTDLNLGEGDDLQLDFFRDKSGKDLMIAAGLGEAGGEVNTDKELKILLKFLDKQNDYDHVVQSGTKHDPILTLLLNGTDGKVHAIQLDGYNDKGDHVSYDHQANDHIDASFFIA